MHYLRTEMLIKEIKKLRAIILFTIVYKKTDE